MTGRRRRRRSPLPAVVWTVSVAAAAAMIFSCLPREGRAAGAGGDFEHQLPEYTGNTQTEDTAPVDPLPQGLPEGMRVLYDKCPEARDYVLGWSPDRTAPDPGEIDLTELANSGSVPALYQWDTRWGYGRYAGNWFGLSGCGPTCLSMAAIYLTGDTSLNPLYVGKFAEDNGFAVAGDGTAWTLFSDGARLLGLGSRELPLDKGQIDRHLRAGEPVVLIVGKGDFTEIGHYLVLTGIGEEGYTLNDPNSPENTAKQWPYDVLEGQIKNIWALSAG